jgi:hypothetical protein
VQPLCSLRRRLHVFAGPTGLRIIFWFYLVGHRSRAMIDDALCTSRFRLSSGFCIGRVTESTKMLHTPSKEEEYSR